MPRTAEATLLHCRVPSSLAGPAPELDPALTPAERGFLLSLQRQALRYFLDNQHPRGLFLDRQRNQGPRRPHGLCSIAATGMGFIALALAAAPPYRLLTPSLARRRIQAGLESALHSLPDDRGVVPHFVSSATGAVYGVDSFSTVETSWLLAGGLWSAAFLGDRDLETLARRLYDRVDWHYWTAPESPGANGLLRHGKAGDGRFLDCHWDRLNGETAFMYVLAVGAQQERAIPASAWKTLTPATGTAGGLRFNNADLGLFVFQYGLDLLDLRRWQAPGPVDLWAEARLATQANQAVCRAASPNFKTYRRFWGLSAGDGPGDPPSPDAYRAYSPAGPIDGTAHLTATSASLVHCPGAVLENLYQAHHDRNLGARGRYGFSNVNLDRHWVGRDMVGIDAGATVLALDNYLMTDRVRRVFHGLPCVIEAMNRLRFKPRPDPSPSPSGANEVPLRRAS